MKNDPLTTILLGALAIFALASVVLCMFYIHDSRMVRTYNANMAFINGRQAFINSLVADVLDYRKRNPSIDPLLESVGLGKNAPAATNNTHAK